MFITNIDTAKRKIIELFPQFQDGDFIANSYGWANFVIEVDKQYIFRFPRFKESFDILKLEDSVLKDLKEILPNNIEIPDFILCNFNLNGPFVGYKKINGEFLSKELYESLSDDKKDAFALNIATALTKLHCLDYTKYNVEIINPKNEFEDLFKKVRDACFKYFNEQEKEWVKQLFNNYFNDTRMNGYLPSLIHGDLSDDHILLKDDNIGIIDFGDVRVFDPAYDLIWTFWFGEELFDRIYKYYKGPKDDNFKYRIQEFYVKRTAFYGIIYGDETNNQSLIDESLEKFRKYIH